MGLGKAVNVVKQGLTDTQKAKLTKILLKRKEELQRAMDDVNEGLKNLKENGSYHELLEDWGLYDPEAS